MSQLSSYRVRNPRVYSESREIGQSSQRLFRTKPSPSKQYGHRKDNNDILHLKSTPKRRASSKMLTEPREAQSPIGKTISIKAISTTVDQSMSPPKLIKKHSQQNPAINLQKTYMKFHELHNDMPVVKTKKYKDFNYKDRYYDMHRRLLQQTNISLLSEAWLAFDQTEMKYIRGWKVQIPFPAYNLTKLLLVYTIGRKVSEYGLDMKHIKIKIKVWQSNTQKTNIVFHNDTIISVYDLVFALMLTNSEEIYDILLVNMGYLVNTRSLSSHNQTQTFHPLYCPTLLLAIPTAQVVSQYRSNFLKELSRSIEHLQMHNTTLTSEQFQMNTCAMDLCILFNACLHQYGWFELMFTAKAHSGSIRYQLGYHYSENRIVKWSKTNKVGQGFKGTLSAWRENNGVNSNSVIAYHRSTNIVVVLMESRRTEGDLQQVVDWCVRNMKGCKKKSYLEECRQTFMSSSKNLNCDCDH